MTEESKEEVEKVVATVAPVNEEVKEKKADPPLEAAARRLDRLLGGAITKDAYSNPSKVVKRWLGTSSGASGKATLADISLAAKNLIPEASSGYQLLKDLSSGTNAGMDVETEASSEESPNKLSNASTVEVETWLLSLAVRILWKQSNHTQAYALVTQGISTLVVYLEHKTKNSLFPLLARLYRYRSLVAESLPPSPTLRADMIMAHGAACLRRDADSQATLLNLLLADLIASNQIEQAQKLLENSNFPETASNNQLCRYLYYSGRIQALRLEYTSAFSNLSQCLRKAPEADTSIALGFRIASQRLLVVVQLLMGEIPDRHVFFQKHMTTELSPYMAIAQAVRRGDLGCFHDCISENASRLHKDGTFTLISRLAHVVVKAGLRKLHISYSRISLQDVADRLGLESARSAEFVVMKAVRDGVLDATVHHTEQYVQSHDLVDVYASKEPTEAFHRRIAYCLTTHNDAVRGMRYPPDAYKKQLEASRGKQRNDDKTDEEVAQELEDEFDEDEY